jgi:hypothetical protein
MCTTKAPKPQVVSGDEKKPVQYLSNPWVDGLGIVGSDARGRNSLRIDRGTPRRPVTVTPPVAPPVITPPNGGGGGFGVGTGTSSPGYTTPGINTGRIVTRER